MIAWIFIIGGALVSVGGVIGLLALFVWLPIKEKFEIVFDKETEFIRARLDWRIHKFVEYNFKILRNSFWVCICIGTMFFFTGIYIGYAEEGQSFWLYQKMFPEVAINQVWDAINDEGQFVDQDGKEYTYYVLVSGKEITLRGEVCSDITDLRNKLSQIKRENTVILVDSFAVSSTYHSVIRVLNELGIEYEETQ